MMKQPTKRQIQEIKAKVKSKITNNQEFKDDDAVIAAAMNMFYDHLKKNKHL